ncbi:MAG: hypothetical protein IJU07_01590 [Synergistaceae bacterium]|nr:hypothetical protein [Synergistaceae bacterium]
MQVTSMLSAGYLEPMQNIQRVQKIAETQKEVDQSKQLKEQEILAEEQALKAKLGDSAQVHTVYHYTMGTDGKRYITGASVTMKGSEEDLNRVSGGLATEDMQSRREESTEALRKDSDKREKNQSVIKSEADKRKAEAKKDKAEDEKDAQVRELKQIENEVIAHEAAHQAAAGELGGGVSYTYTEGPDGHNYITGGEVPIRFKEGATPEETLRNMQRVQAAANAPADPSGQDRQVAAKAAALASKARAEISNERAERSEENNGEHTETVAKGTPVFERVSRDDDRQDAEKNGVMSVLASVKELQLMSLIPAA